MLKVVKYLVACAALFFAACDSKGADPEAGIEIGNPSVGLAAQFVLDYGEPDYSALQKFAKLPSDSEPLVVTDFRLGLSEVRHFSSYYILMPTDPLLGLRIWPQAGSTDTVIPMTFNENGTSNVSFKDWEMPSEGLLKEIGFQIRNTQDSNIAIRGEIRTASGLKPFEFELRNWESLLLRFHANQIESTGDSGFFNLPIRFHVPRWIAGVDFSSAVEDGYGVIRITPSSNSAIWEALNENFPASFNCLRWQETWSNGRIEQGYAPAAVSIFDKPSRNWVQDTLFKNPEAHWIFVKQFGGSGTVTYNSDGSATIDVTKAGSEVFSIQFLQENIPVIAGKNYRISFKASSSIGSEIIVRMGLYHSPYSGISPDFYFGLYDQLGVYDREFVATETNLFTRLEFNLGGKVRKVVLSDIKVEQLD